MFSLVKSGFELSFRNIITERYVGESAGYSCEQTAVGTTNGAGPHNVQLFVLAPCGTVLHCLPGFWHPEDLAWQLRFAQRLNAVWTDATLTREQKCERASQMQREALATQPRAMFARSGWQGFDARKEQTRRDAGEERDTFRVRADGKVELLRINEIVHQRMAQRPFVPFEHFDTPQFCDYGRIQYDNNRKVDGRGETFMTPRRVEKQERRDERREAQMRQRLQQQADRLAQRMDPRRLRIPLLFDRVLGR